MEIANIHTHTHAAEQRMLLTPFMLSQPDRPSGENGATPGEWGPRSAALVNGM